MVAGFGAQDQDFLQKLLECADSPFAGEYRCAVLCAGDIDAIFKALRQSLAPVVLCDQDSMPGIWKEMLIRFALLDQPPCLIVVSRLADDRFWAEALNRGAYDVLLRPFDRSEVIRSVGIAILHYEYRIPHPVRNHGAR